MRYFPDSCQKKVPDRGYFWKVLGNVMPEEYQNFLRSKLAALKKKRKIKDDKLVLTREACDTFEEFDFEDTLALLGIVKS